MTEVKTEQELDAALAMLPPFSRQVYDAIQKGLYAEPGFSDVVVDDIAATLACKPVAVNAAVGKLIAAGLVWSDDTEVNGEPRVFLYTYEHSEELRQPSTEDTLEAVHMDGHHDGSPVAECGLCIALADAIRKDAIRAAHVRAQKRHLTTPDQVAQSTDAMVNTAADENSFPLAEQRANRGHTAHGAESETSEAIMDGDAVATEENPKSAIAKPKAAGGKRALPDGMTDGGKIFQIDPRKLIIPLHDKPIAVTDPLYDEKRLMSDEELKLDELIESMDKSNADAFAHVVIREGDAWVLIGGRTTRAARVVWAKREKAGKPPPNFFVVVRSGDANALATANLVSDYNRVDDSPMTQAKKFTRLMDSRGWTRKTLAFLTGQTEQTIKNTVNLLKLVPELQNAVDTELGATVGYKLAELKPEKQAAVLSDLKNMAEARGGKIRKIDAEIAVQRAKGVADPEAAAIEAGAGDAEVPDTTGKPAPRGKGKPKVPKASSQDGNGPKYEPIQPSSLRRLARAIEAGRKCTATEMNKIAPNDADLATLSKVDALTLLQVIAGLKNRTQATGLTACLHWSGVKLST